MIILIIALFLSGCISYDCLQDANIQEPGKIAGGMGITSVNSGYTSVKCLFRVGVFQNSDVGLKFGAEGLKGYLEFTDIDVRYRIISIPVRVFAGCILSNFVLDSYPNSGFSAPVQSLQPFALVGQDSWYFAFRPYYSFGTGTVNLISGTPMFEKHQWSAFAYTLGGSIPLHLEITKSRIFFEVNVVRFKSDVSLIQPAIGWMTDF